MVSENGFRLFPDDVYHGDRIQIGTDPAVYEVIDSMQTNNGNFRAVDSENRLQWANTVTDDVRIIQRGDKSNDCRRQVEKIPATDRKTPAVHVTRIIHPIHCFSSYNDYESYIDSLEDRCLPNDSDL